MRKISLYIASSLDGYIARQSGEVDWLFTDQDYGYTEFFAKIDTVIMGRKTYQQVLDFGEYPYQEKEGFVFSKTMQGESNHNVKFIGSDWKDFINTLRHSNGGNIWLVGGAAMIYSFMKHNLIDEIILAIHPIILGDGIPLIIKDPTLETKLEFKDIKTYDSGLVQVSYNLNKNF